jgi:integrase
MTARQRGSSIQRVETKSGPRWRFRIDLEPGPDGKRRQRTLTFRSEADAVRAQAQARADVNRGVYLEPSTVTLAEWLEHWLRVGKRTWRASTHSGYDRALKPAREALGARRVQQLRRGDIEALVTDMLASGGNAKTGRSPRTVAILIGLLRKALDEAVVEGIISTNPARYVKKPPQQVHEMKTWTAAQMRTFLDHVEDDDLSGAWALTAMGLRRGEVLGLRWSDIDFENRVLHVRQARVLAGREVVTNAPKTARGRRSIPMHAGLIEALKLTRRRTLTESPVVPLRQKQGGDRLVAVDAVGEPMHPDAYSDRFARLVKDAALPTIRLHDMRHTALSLMLEQGIPVSVVARIAGHDPSVTMRTYAHAADDATRRAVDALGAIYAGR